MKTILEDFREDNDTGSLPAEGDLVWGHGKVTASQAVMSALLDLTRWTALLPLGTGRERVARVSQPYKHPLGGAWTRLLDLDHDE